MNKYKSRKIFIVLAILLGNFGVHQLYMENYKRALLYFAFCWTGIPYIVSIYDVFTTRKPFENIEKTNSIEDKTYEAPEGISECNNHENEHIKEDKVEDDVLIECDNIIENDIEIKNTFEESKEVVVKNSDLENIIETISVIDNEELIKEVMLENQELSDSEFEVREKKQELLQKLQGILENTLVTKALDCNKAAELGEINELDCENIEELESLELEINIICSLDDVEDYHEKQLLIEKMTSILNKVLKDKEGEELKKLPVNNISEEKEKQRNNRFYDEDSIILDKYRHITTPKEILDSVNRYRLEGGFILDSIKYSNMPGIKCELESFMEYWPTFRSLNYKQKQWYFYWRGCVLNKNYIDTDLSYIFIFIYELLNYSFNKNAAFNISMLEHLKEAYSSRFNTLERYLNRWMNDFLVELNEEDLIKENYVFEDRMYKLLKENTDKLDKISITEWKRFIIYNNTKFFEKHKNKVYKAFKQTILMLSNFYLEKNNESILKEWYTRKLKDLNVPDYRTAMIDRDVRIKEIKTNTYEPNNKMHKQVTEVFRLSENLIREKFGENRKINVDTECFPEGFMEHFNEKKKEVIDLDLTKRFKEVTKGKKDLSVKIPKRIDNDATDISKVNKIEFDDEVINDLGKEGDNLINIFNEKYENSVERQKEKLISKSETYNVTVSNKVDFDEAVITRVNKDDTELMNIFDKDTSGKEEVLNIFEDNNIEDLFNNNVSDDIEGFTQSLNDLEINFIKQFKGLVISAKEAAMFAKENCKMISIFIEGINQKSLEFIGDTFIYSENSNYYIYEDYLDVFNEIKGLRKNEN